MRMFEANTTVLRDLQDESEIIARKEAEGFTVITARHPTLGKLVLVAGRSGAGIVVETEE